MSNNVIFKLGDMVFEYDENKNQANISKHGISFKIAARVFFDYDRIEMYDEENSAEEERYDTIGNVQIGSDGDDILFVVYTERIMKIENGEEQEITRIISARFATNFERGLYYGKI